MKTSPALRLVTALIVFVTATSAWSCPDFLKAHRTRFLGALDICAAHDRYQEALEAMRQKNGVTAPERTGNLMAPRFINLPDWLKKRDVAPTAAWRAYEPAPMTWFAWEKGAAIIDSEAKANFAAQRIPAIGINWLNRIHATALNGLLRSAGRFRTGPEFGLALNADWSLTASEVEGARAIEYEAILTPGSKLVSFRPTQCMNQRLEEFQKEYPKRGFHPNDWPEAGFSDPVTGPNGEPRYCGFFTYAPIEEVKPQMKAWFEYVNAAVASWTTDRPEGDPILVAARVQRWFIAIHPYLKGNGRVSRFVMEWLLESLGLPAPVLKNMNEDMYLTEENWAREVGDGILRAIVTVEQCVQSPQEPGCAPIATPTGDTP